MKLTILAVGKIKERYLIDAIADFSKRIGRFADLNIIEVADEKTPDNLREQEINIVKKKEGERLLKYIKNDGYIFALSIEGNMLSSVKFSELLNHKATNGYSHFYFIIGGSVGLSDDVLKASDYSLSFSKMTFPHQLMRLILVEQIYRGFKIIRGETYHK